MQSEADSTSISYSKFPSYIQSYSANQHLTAGYDHSVGYAPVGYTTVPHLQSRSTHQTLPFESQPRLGEYGVTPSPSDGNSSDTNKETLFRPIDFEGFSAASTHTSRSTSLPLTPTDSAESSDRDSSPTTEQDPKVLVVRIPRNLNPSAEKSVPTELESLSHGITVNLLDRELWQTFKSVGNEMIVTKPGRRLFPALLVGLRGLDLKTEYSVSLRISSADPYRYKFLNMKWVGVGESEVMQNEERQIYLHPNSPNCGQFWMKKPISFKQVKITHNSTSKNNNILLHTMHKYMMEIVLKPAGQPEVVIQIPDTDFVAVTAYQNTKITQLKIDNNPFAKGFRDRENAGFPHPSSFYSSPLPLPSLYGSPSGQTPLWHQLPQLACPIPPLISSECRSRSSSPDEEFHKQDDDLPSQPIYPYPSLPAQYPYYPSVNPNWSVSFPHQAEPYCPE